MTDATTLQNTAQGISASEAGDLYMTGVTAAISESLGWIEGQAHATAAQYEALGIKMADLASDYAQRLMQLSEGQGTPAELAMYDDMAGKIYSEVENMRLSRDYDYAQYGEKIAKATRAALIATTAERVGSVYDSVKLANDVAGALETDNWDKVGETAAVT